MRKALKSFLTIFICVSVTAVSAQALESTPGGIQWQSYDAGLALAASSGKKIYVNFHADWCTYCTKMANTTFKSKKVIAFLNEYFVPVQVDTNKEKALARKFKVRGLPLSWFLDEGGNPINFRAGYMDPSEFLNMLQFMVNEG
ncbi:thioredoxin fold domain-containing protein [Desulfoluna sp.]|uniref:thioredoxin family protein n=1 Tax=Desulfoluna sp. TaxID=2045199 RepID=UPI0026203809|nr:thioredoxin fold domain-containing protein [Desulfoluna sp.]